MFKRKFHLLAMMAILSSVSLGIQGAQEPSSGKPTFSVAVQSLVSTLKVGSEVRLKILLTNTSDHRLILPKTVFSDIEIRNSLGNKLSAKEESGSVAEAHNVRDIRLSGGSKLFAVDPGQANTEEVVLNRIYDLSQPGVFTVQVQRFDNDNKLAVKSNTLTLILTP